MNWEAAGAIGEIVGAIAVITTLVYLGRQVSQSVEVARAAQNKSIMDSWEGFNDLILSNPELPELLSRLKTSDHELSESQLVQVHHFAYRILNTIVAAEISYRNQQLSRAEFDVHQQALESLLGKYPGFAPYMFEIYDLYPSTRDYEIYEPIRKLREAQ
ncbi:MAG: hypothetical protein ACI9BW_004311 [Gammaproteobacteria bacterium]|jgi:hypothetical protein